MSELKVHKAYNRWIDEEMPTPNDDLICNEFYLKSEADKVIAEKDKDIQRLENLCESYRIDCDNLAIREANACKEIGRDNKQIRHQKYKRCLAMAMLSLEKRETYRAEYEEWCLKWHQRWQELAGQFKDKEAK